MLADTVRAVSTCGLEIHPGKTKILSNARWRRGESRHEFVNIGSMKLEILKRESFTKYLGRKITFQDVHKSELENRLAAGWRKFAVFKQELTGKTYPLRQRLRLFESLITPTVLYGASCWTLTVALEGVLRKTQRRMLRLVLASGRKKIQHPTEETSTNSSGADVESVVG
eukprot:6487414-Karenia_brevis.AAC.1